MPGTWLAALRQPPAPSTPRLRWQQTWRLATRLADVRLLGKLSSDYRTDRKLVASFTKDTVDKDSAQQNLHLAVSWKQASEAVSAAEAAHAPTLGPYYAGASTDWGQLDRALAAADAAVRAAGGQDLSRAAALIGRDAPANPAITDVAASAAADLNGWFAAISASRRAASAPPELLNGTIGNAIGWLRAHLQPLHSASSFTREVSSVVGRSLTVGEARHLVALRDETDRAYADLTERDTEFRDSFGDLYAGYRTDIASLRSALEWARRLRINITGSDSALSPLQAKAADSVVQTTHLGEAAEAWLRAGGALLAAFNGARQREMTAELDEYDDARGLIEALREDTGGQDEWHVYQSCRAALAAHGLDVAVEFCIAEGVPSEQVPQVLERALLQEWSDHYLATEPDLSAVRAADRDERMREYQELDRTLSPQPRARSSALATRDARAPTSAKRPSSIVKRKRRESTCLSAR